MNAEQIDIDSWSADWQSTGTEQETSLDSIRRGFRRYTWSAIGSWLVGLTMVVGTTAMGWREREAPLIAAAIAVWILVAAAVAFDLRYRRGTWRLAGESTRDYLELGRRQLIARLRGIRFGWGLLAAEVVFFSFWIPWVVGPASVGRSRALLESFGFLLALVVVFAIGLAAARRRARSELRRLDRIGAALAVDPETA